MNQDDELIALKKLNKQLKREIARLNKLLNQEVLIKEEKTESFESEIEESQEPNSTKKCPLCNSKSLVNYQTPSGKNIVSCKDCKKYRKATK